MGEVLKAKLFTHGGSQAVRLPKAFRFEGTEVRIRRDGDKVILEPVRAKLSDLWAELDALAEPEHPFPYPPKQPPAPDPDFEW
ncbi:antitoxin [Phenylobacterium sp.]|uniref:antitoxin n=1 Tax=Phenylobacterium sp. TaxID=1871053 RepID=UPI00271B798D|nr:AbrB/MazE/SpoVT family DNA-binding domain-containing protein [Phenylobacterium sp.]MDO8378163.1 AbrB/MazE/SpoVT family DNA-binding domain-containing protein [Phenylobacterium sp.]